MGDPCDEKLATQYEGAGMAESKKLKIINWKSVLVFSAAIASMVFLVVTCKK
jgi:hypothetical protein